MISSSFFGHEVYACKTSCWDAGAPSQASLRKQKGTDSFIDYQLILGDSRKKWHIDKVFWEIVNLAVNGSSDVWAENLNFLRRGRRLLYEFIGFQSVVDRKTCLRTWVSFGCQRRLQKVLQKHFKVWLESLEQEGKQNWSISSKVCDVLSAAQWNSFLRNEKPRWTNSSSNFVRITRIRFKNFYYLSRWNETFGFLETKRAERSPPFWKYVYDESRAVPTAVNLFIKPINETTLHCKQLGVHSIEWRLSACQN